VSQGALNSFKEKFSEMISGIINVDERRLLWVMPDKTQPMKGDKYKSGKKLYREINSLTSSKCYS
jgi:hypothetical protein